MTKILDALSSLKLFFVLCGLLLAAFLAGGLFPQGLSPQEYHEMFGSVGAAWITKARLNDVFSSPWFLLLMAGTVVNLLACTVKQWKLIRLRPGVFISHVAVILIFIGGAVRGVSRVSGTLALQTGESKSEFTTPEGTAEPLPFEVALKDFQVTYWEGETHLLHAVHGDEVVETVAVKEGGDAVFTTVPVNVKVLKYYPNFNIGPSGPFSNGDVPANPALTIVDNVKTNARPQYLFARYPDYHGSQDNSGVRLIYENQAGRIKQFESRIAISENGALKFEKPISVNSPAYYRGYRLYQAGYDEQNPRFSSIQISLDRSVWIIYAGFALLMAGLTLAFWKEIQQ